MPCDDITETLNLQLDEHERLSGYRLAKRTCGRAVGQESLLAAELAGRDARAILDMDVEDFVADKNLVDEVETFLTLKHFFAVKAGLRVFLGIESGAAGEPCTVATVICESGQWIVEVDISVEALTQEIKSCGNCKGCGALKKMFKQPARMSFSESEPETAQTQP